MRRNKYIFKNMVSILSNKYVSLFLVISMFIIGYFCSTLEREKDYLVAFNFSLTYQPFLTLCILPIIVLGDVLVIKFFEQNKMILMYFKNKKKYVKELLKHIVGISSYLFLVLMIIILTCFNLFSNHSFIIRFDDAYGTINLTYAIFIILKLYLLTLFTSFLFTFITLLWNRYISLVSILFFSTTLFISSHKIDMIENLSNIPIYIGYYFLNEIEYSTFSFQVMCFIIIMSIYTALLYFIYRIILKKRKDLIN